METFSKLNFYIIIFFIMSRVLNWKLETILNKKDTVVVKLHLSCFMDFIGISKNPNYHFLLCMPLNDDFRA